MNQFLKRVLYLALAISPLAQAEDTQYWSSLQVTSQATEKLSTVGELIHRYSDSDTEFVTESARLGLSYKFNSGWSYALIYENRRTNSINSNEVRYIHQLGRKYEFEKFDAQLRFRLEQRDFWDSEAISNRARALLRIDGTAYEFWGITPYASAEYFYTLNTVVNRAEGSDETRLQVGGAKKVGVAKVEVSYTDRTIQAEPYKTRPFNESRYDVFQLALKWNY